MTTKLCACCGSHFQPVAQVPNQTFCSKSACQRVRRQRWNQQKLENDPDYRDNKQRSQRDWMDRNPGYWRQYRADNPDYTERNRSSQRGKTPPYPSPVLAKKDESNHSEMLRAGTYQITPLHRQDGENNGIWIVELALIRIDSD